MYALTPTYRPVGGVIKVFDYALHALRMGLRVQICAPEPYADDLPIFQIPGLEALRAGGDVTYRGDFTFSATPDDVVFFSWPTHYERITARLRPTVAPQRVIHVVQNVRHANPEWIDGYALRLLTRPMTRVVVNDRVLEAVDPHLNRSCPTRLIRLGHRVEYFSRRRPPGLGRPVRVGYTTWKSDAGDRVARALSGDPGFRFRSIRRTVAWPQLRELYHWCDVFLGTPGPEEGHYLPGLEAMAAGAVVVVPDVGGNLVYCRFGRNCLQVPFGDAGAYVDALRRLAARPEEADRLREAGYEEVTHHTLRHERQAFAGVLDEVTATPPRPAPPRRRRPPARSADIVVTGPPRSGTTLVTHLLNRLPDTVALSEPLGPSRYKPLRIPGEVCDVIAGFFDAQRAAILADHVAVSKAIGGRDTDNFFEAAPTTDGLRHDIAERGHVRVDKELSAGFRLVIKDLATFTALLGPLSRRFPCFGLVRNPLAVLASWNSVDIPMREGRSPHAEWFDEELGRFTSREGERVERQLRLLSWWYGRLRDALPPEQVLRYEDVVASGGRALRVIAPEAEDLDETLSSRNVNELYDHDEMRRLGDRLLAAGGAWRHFYGDDEVRELLAGLDHAPR
ncbi:MAG: glycosyltransferase [Actinomycetota bacterium]|nr:glycosyltransferase [Actinomycetota bacterium]